MSLAAPERDLLSRDGAHRKHDQPARESATLREVVIGGDKLLLLEREHGSKTWLVTRPARDSLSARGALGLLRRVWMSGSRTAVALRRVIAGRQLGHGAESSDPELGWSRLEQDVQRGRLGVVVEPSPLPRIDPDVRLPAPVTPQTPEHTPTEIVEDDRALFITSCDPEVGGEGPLHFSYLIRELPGQTTLAISADGLGGAVVHERVLDPDETRDGVHEAEWDGIVSSAGELQGQRLRAQHGPCTLEIIHDDRYRDLVRFRVLDTLGFEVLVVDDIGEPVEGVDVEFLLNGQASIVTTDADGLARHPGTEAAELRSAGVRLADIDAVRELLEPRWSEARDGSPPEPNAQVVHVPVKPSWRGATLERGVQRTLVLLPSSVRVRLEGMHFDTSKSFLLPGAMRGIARLREIYEEHPEGRVVVCGHTDTAGGKDYNIELSLERAESVIAYLTDDVDAWNVWFGDDRSADKRWGTVEIQHMLMTRPSAQSPYYSGPADGIFGTNTRKGVEQLQAAHGLPVTGQVDDGTRRALIGEYMSIDGTTLPDGVEIEPHGCGELFPDTQTADAVTFEDNRRVDVFFFDGAVNPACPGPLASEGEREYPIWRDRALETHVLDADATAVEDSTAQVHILLRSNSRSVPLADRPYRLDVDGTIHEGVSDEEGLVRVDDIASGDYGLEVEELRSIVATRPRGAAPVVHVIAGYYLLPPA